MVRKIGRDQYFFRELYRPLFLDKEYGAWSFLGYAVSEYSFSCERFFATHDDQVHVFDLCPAEKGIQRMAAFFHKYFGFYLFGEIIFFQLALNHRFQVLIGRRGEIGILSKDRIWDFQIFGYVDKVTFFDSQKFNEYSRFLDKDVIHFGEIKTNHGSGKEFHSK